MQEKTNRINLERKRPLEDKNLEINKLEEPNKKKAKLAEEETKSESEDSLDERSDSESSDEESNNTPYTTNPYKFKFGCGYRPPVTNSPPQSPQLLDLESILEEGCELMPFNNSAKFE
jgi:hypothetical protein